MVGNIEERIRLLISVRRKLQAQLIFCRISCNDDLKNTIFLTKTCHARVQRLLEGIDGLLLLVTEEERFILELHLVDGLKWETVIEEYCKRWTSEISHVERTYKYRQQGALRKMKDYIVSNEDMFDFSWLDDPLIDELATLNPKQ